MSVQFILSHSRRFAPAPAPHPPKPGEPERNQCGSQSNAVDLSNGIQEFCVESRLCQVESQDIIRELRLASKILAN